ncbi:hypothetical protein AB0901_00220 [Streptomyces roseifaciens]
MSEISALWQIAPSAETDWLVKLCEDEGSTGFPPPGMPDAAWVLNAMYEHEQGPGPVSHHQVRQAGLADGSIEPAVFHSAPDGRAEDGSWPVGIRPPTEGSLDRETWSQLIEILQRYSPAGPDTCCLAYYNPLMMRTFDFDNLHVLSGRLGDAQVLYDIDEPDFSPSNLCPEDRSWIVYTDYDLWGTKVVGPTAPIDALVCDTEIEAVRLPWAP